MSQSKAEKESFLTLRRMIRGELKEHSNDHWYCEKCDCLIVEPDGNYGRVADVDGAVETVQHYVECEFTKRRVELMLEDPQVRSVSEKKEKINDLEGEISAQESELAALREDLKAVKGSNEVTGLGPRSPGFKLPSE